MLVYTENSHLTTDYVMLKIKYCWMYSIEYI